MSEPRWFKSSHSANNGSCVEVAFSDRRVRTRDSKNPDAGCLSFPPDSWTAFRRAFR
ncbi:DUF397 domain-containing protein [Saccharothrix longispora]|uniref:DUF397 domain-containing protein n=1 Tax=Saccharothrix longispora TaxID=33920 RepID=UPI0028FD6456|nr:DUF397 domain-containing protein [Saccharothrix longispora]MDU0291427.1 DUF397 domain-containing protein [Saccharothrix longispora]